jgi:hypothetical protein
MAVAPNPDCDGLSVSSVFFFHDTLGCEILKKSDLVASGMGEIAMLQRIAVDL